MPVLPFHRYIGPGNDIDSGPCVDEDDCIAKKHDIKYENARTFRDVRLADVEAISEFRSNWLAGNWHSLIGDIGLSLKYCVETYTGVLYPNLSEYQQCEILSLFHDFLRLHCVNKVRPFDRYRQPLISSEQQDQWKMYDFTKRNLSDEIYFYVMVAWYQLYRKNEQHQYIIPAESTSLNKPKTIILPQQNSHIIQNCDIFHLKTWIRFFAFSQVSKMPSDDYNDEEFSNMFMLYD